MIYRFEYKTFPEGNTERKKRPILRLTLRYGKESLTADGIVDSGSDKTISHEVFARDIGIVFESKKLREESEIKTGIPFDHEIIGLNNQPIPVYVVPVELEIAGKKLDVPVHWIKKEQPFTPKIDFPFILGQDSIFELFDVHFSERQRAFFLNDDVFSPKL